MMPPQDPKELAGWLEGLALGRTDGAMRLRNPALLADPRPGVAAGYEIGQQQALAARVAANGGLTG